MNKKRLFYQRSPSSFQSSSINSIRAVPYQLSQQAVTLFQMIMNDTTEQDEEMELMEFQIFDSRDLMNVVSYAIMSLSKIKR